ncbi:Precorrin-8X methylmutase [uncultured delta proteobacterium]|uniref:Precorrin-8X methylmutase n=1 Tax=uncultured delta proteobacterium TaxID=34034 RepID=A0A212IZC2_9DELT|nr:Precorrin-8X methylmutase [uncultured delta proteobacterium]
MERLQPQKDPAAIERRSFAIIDAEAGDPKPFSGLCWEVARRLVHTTADFSILDNLIISDAAVLAGVTALREGRPVFTDTRMALAGVPERRLTPLGVKAACLLTLPGVAERAQKAGITQSRAAVELAGDLLENAILAVGNAPTTLIALIQYLREGGKAPALVIGMPVGFVNAAESKELLLEETGLHSIVIRGRRGGSPLAAATVNALAEIALRGRA